MFESFKTRILRRLTGRRPAPPHDAAPAARPVSGESDWTRRASLGAIVAAAASLPKSSAAQSGILDPAAPLAGAGTQDAGIAHRRTPTASVTSVHGKLRHIVFAAEDYGFVPGGRPAANAAALQRAVDEAQIVHLPNSDEVAVFGRTIALPPHTILVGAGAERSRIAAEAPLAFLYEAPRGLDVWGPRFDELSLFSTGSGIRLNSPRGGFSVDGTTQMSVMRPRMTRVKVFGPGNAGTVGIEWNKVFDGVIDQCEILGFATGLRSLGSDLCEMRGRTRVWQCGTLVDIHSITSYGSGFILGGCDFLDATECFLRSSDLHLQVIGCYFETYSKRCSGPVLDLAPAYVMLFQNNRFETPAARAPRLMVVAGEAGLFAWENNYTLGEAWGTVRWNDGRGARYWKGSLHRQRILVRGSTTGFLDPPFNTIDAVPPRSYREPWRFTPAMPGLLPLNYGLTCRARDGAFVLPAMAGAGSLIRFRAESDRLSGRVNVHARMWSATAGQRIECMLLRGSAWQATAERAVDPSPGWHSLFEATEVDDLELHFRNVDTARGGEVLISDIVVERA